MSRFTRLNDWPDRLQRMTVDDLQTTVAEWVTKFLDWQDVFTRRLRLGSYLSQDKCEVGDGQPDSEVLANRPTMLVISHAAHE